MGFEPLFALLIATSATPPAARVGTIFERLVTRNGDICPLRIEPPLRRCRGSVVVIAGKRPRAGAGIERITISKGMAELARDDDSLAFVLAHELAHIQLAHVPGRAGKAGELDADRTALWLTARAGFNPAAAIGLVARVAGSRGFLFITAGGHPSPKRRRREIAAELVRIQAAQASGVPLAPPMFVSPR